MRGRKSTQNSTGTTHLNKAISERFQSHFSEYSLMILKYFFRLNLFIYMDRESFVVFWKSFPVLLRFLVKNAKKQRF